MKKWLFAFLISAASPLLISGAFAAASPRVGIVAKIGGIPWFNAMEVGIQEEGRKRGIDAFMVGPTSADPALQVRAIEDLIAQRVQVIGVVPNDSAALEPVLTRAKAAGIKVITHESPSQKAADWDFELASIKGFGEAHAELLAQEMGKKGAYAVLVGSLTVPLHNAWADAAIAYIQEKYPEMRLIDRYGGAEDVDQSRTTSRDLIAAHPDLKGFLAFGSQGPIGAGRAVEERRKVGQISVVGVFSPGQGRKLVKSGVVSGGFMWSPRQAGEIFVILAEQLIQGKSIQPGETIPGLGTVHPVGNTIAVDLLVPINRDTIDALADAGL